MPSVSNKKFGPVDLAPGALSEVSDRELTSRLDVELRSYTPRARRFALMVGGGASLEEAAKAARLSTHQQAVQRVKVRVRAALALMQEQGRRASRLSLNTAVERFDALSKEAQAEKDYGAAARSLSEACKLLGLYPESRLKIEHSVNFSEVTPDEWEALALLRHGVRQDVIEAHAVEVPALPAHEDKP